MASNNHNSSIILLISILTILASSTLLPQFNVMMEKNLLNAQISTNLGPQIQKKIQQFQIPPISFNDTFQGVHVNLNLTNVNKTFGINWNANVLEVVDQYNWKIRSQNINLTMNSHIEFKIGLAVKQKGQLNITASKIIVTTSLRFQQPKSRPSIGFDLQISDVFVSADQIDIKIQHKTIDNLIIRLLQRLLKSRVPGIINKAIINQVDPYISQLTANAVSQVTPGLGPELTKYVVSLNTTQVPKFHIENKQQLVLKVDLTLQNQLTNATNPQIEDQSLLQQHSYSKDANATMAMSSNMINSILWLIQDSKLLHATITQKDLGPDPLINLTTKDLAILIPDLNNHWTNKDVVIAVKPSSNFDDLYIRSGRLIGGISLSIQFVVNLTDTTSTSVEQCIQKKQCVSAVTLNITIPFSLSIRINKNVNFMQGLIQSLKIYQISVIKSEVVKVNTNSLKTIINALVGSELSTINDGLIKGQFLKLPKMITDLNVTGVLSGMHKDYLDLGLLIKI